MARQSVSKIRLFVEQHEGEKFWVGIDVHKVNYHVCLYSAAGEYLTWVCPVDAKQLVSLFMDVGVAPHKIACESGSTGFGLARECEGVGLDCIVVAPNKVPRAVTAGAKTDRLDCIKLAKLCAKDMLRGIAVPTPEFDCTGSVVHMAYLKTVPNQVHGA